MKNFIEKGKYPAGFLFFLLFALMFEIAMAFLPEQFLLDPPFEQSALRLKAEVADRGGDYDVLILGDCTGWAGLRPKLFEEQLGLKTYNFSFNVGQTFLINYIILKRYLVKSSTPKLAIVEVSATSLLTDLTMDFKRLQGNVLPYFRMDEDIVGELPENVKKEYARYQLKTFLPSLKKQYLMKKDLWFLKILQSDLSQYAQYTKYFEDEHGFWNEDMDFRKVPLVKMEDKDLHPGYKASIRAEYNLRYLGRILEELHKRNIKVVLITTPVRRDELELWKPYNVRERLNQVLTEVARSHENVAGFWDLSESVTDLKYYADSTHVNSAGANLYSTQVAGLIQGLNKRGL